MTSQIRIFLLGVLTTPLLHLQMNSLSISEERHFAGIRCRRASCTGRSGSVHAWVVTTCRGQHRHGELSLHRAGLQSPCRKAGCVPCGCYLLLASVLGFSLDRSRATGVPVTLLTYRHRSCAVSFTALLPRCLSPVFPHASVSSPRAAVALFVHCDSPRA